MNIRVDLNYPISDGTEAVFRSPVDCSQVTGLKVYYDGGAGSQEFAFADAHGNNVGDIDHLFAENVVVKVILDVTTGMAFVQNADTNAYLESRFDGIIDKLCPSFTEKGTVVTCEPVEGYPLEVVSMIAPVQNGSGNPSPNNIRPITGYSTLTLQAGLAADEGNTQQNRTFTMEPGQTVYGGSLDWASGVLTLDRYCRTFTGEEAWFWVGDANNNYNANYRPLLYLTDSALFAKDKSVPCLCSHFKYEPLVDINGGTDIGCFISGDLICIRHGLGAQLTTIEAWKEWLAAQYQAGTPVQLCYELAQPITVQLTPREIPALPGTNCLYSDTGDTQVTGRADIGRYIDKKFAELASAIVNNT